MAASGGPDRRMAVSLPATALVQPTPLVGALLSKGLPPAAAAALLLQERLATPYAARHPLVRAAGLPVKQAWWVARVRKCEVFA